MIKHKKLQDPGLLSMKQADSIFSRYAVLLGDRDGIPFELATEIYGRDAMLYVLNQKNRLHYDGIEVEGRTVCFLTISGARQAVTYNNLQYLAKNGIARQDQADKQRRGRAKIYALPERGQHERDHRNRQFYATR